MTGYTYMVVEYTVEYSNPNVKPERVRALISTKDWIKAHFGDSPTYTILQNLKEMSVLKMYGVPQNRLETEQILLAYQRDFPPEAFDIEATNVQDVDGWLSPEGLFYKSGWMGHSNLALDLAVGYLQLEPDESRYEDALYRTGWISIGHMVVMSGMFDHRVLPTDAQLRWLNRLRELNADFKSYVENIDRFLNRAQRVSERS